MESLKPISELEQEVYHPWTLFFNKYGKYNVGVLSNFKQTFGNNVFYWCLPVYNLELDGYEFPINRLYQTMEKRIKEETV